MGALLEAESRRLENEQRWVEIESAYARIQATDPAGWDNYLAEIGSVTGPEPDPSAIEEWPEYNR